MWKKNEIWREQQEQPIYIHTVATNDYFHGSKQQTS